MDVIDVIMVGPGMLALRTDWATDVIIVRTWMLASQNGIDQDIT